MRAFIPALAFALVSFSSFVRAEDPPVVVKGQAFEYTSVSAGGVEARNAQGELVWRVSLTHEEKPVTVKLLSLSPEEKTVGFGGLVEVEGAAGERKAVVVVGAVKAMTGQRAFLKSVDLENLASLVHNGEQMLVVNGTLNVEIPESNFTLRE